MLSQGTMRETRDGVCVRGRAGCSPGECGGEREVEACPPWLRGGLQRWPLCPGAQH